MALTVSTKLEDDFQLLSLHKTALTTTKCKGKTLNWSGLTTVLSKLKQFLSQITTLTYLQTNIWCSLRLFMLLLTAESLIIPILLYFYVPYTFRLHFKPAIFGVDGNQSNRIPSIMWTNGYVHCYHGILWGRSVEYPVPWAPWRSYVSGTVQFFRSTISSLTSKCFHIRV
jgi:hypothetical protein